MAAQRKPISATTRYKVLDRDGYTCQSCGAKAPDVTLQVDHIKAVSKGGTNQVENLRAICVACNLGKSDADMQVAKVELPLEPGKHPLTGWAFLSYTTDADGKEQVQWQGVIRNVVPSGSATGDLAIVDFFEWMIGEYTYSSAIPLTAFSKPFGSPQFFKLFASNDERNEYYSWKHGRRSGDD